MIQKIGDPMKSDGGLPASCRTLDHQDLIPGIADDLILLFLDGTDNVFQLHIPVVAQLLLQDLVVDLGVALKPVHHFPVTDLILPLSAYFPADNSAGRLIRSRPPVEIIEQAAHRRPPVVDQRQPAVSFVKIPDPNIDGLRIFFSLKPEIHSSKEGGAQHTLITVPFAKDLLIGVHLVEKGLLVVVILIAVLVHIRIVFPVIFVHGGDLFFSFSKRVLHCFQTAFQLFCHKLQKPGSVEKSVVVHLPSSYPSATSRIIIRANPRANPMVPILLWEPWADSGTSSSTTT